MTGKIQAALAIIAIISFAPACSQTPNIKKSGSVTSIPAVTPVEKAPPEVNVEANVNVPTVSPKKIETSAPVPAAEIPAQSRPAEPAVSHGNPVSPVSEEEKALEKTRVYLITQSPGNEIMEAFGHAEIEWDIDGNSATSNTILSFSPNIGALNKALTEAWKILNSKNLKDLSPDETIAKKKISQAKKDFVATLSSIMKQDLAMSITFLDSIKYFSAFFKNAQNRKMSRDELILSIQQKKKIAALLPMITDPRISREFPFSSLRYKYTEFNCSSTLRDLILSEASYDQTASTPATEAAFIIGVEEFFTKSKSGITQASAEAQKVLNKSIQTTWKDLLGKSTAIAIQDSKTHSLLVSRPETLGMKSDDPYYDFVVSQTSFKSFDDMEKAFLNGDLISRFLNLLSLGSQGAVVFNDSQIKILQEATQSLATDPSLKVIPNLYESMALPIYLQAELAKLVNSQTGQPYLKCVGKAEQPDSRFEECKN